MMTAIPHLRPWILPEDRKAVDRALSEKSVCSFHYAEMLSKELESYAGFGTCRLFSSGTLALRAALLCSGIPEGSGVGIPSFTCSGVLGGVLTAGLRPYVIDCDDSGLMSADHALEAFKNGHIGACCAVHQFGLINRSVESLTGFMPVFEDCSHVLPKRYLNGSRGIFGSLEGTKLLGAGEGGYLILDVHCRQGDAVRNIHINLGGRLSDIIAVLALKQLDRIEENILKRESIAVMYKKVLHSIVPVDGERGTWFRFLLTMDSMDQTDDIIKKAGEAGITLRRPVMPHCLHKYIDEYRDKCPNSDRLWERMVSLPMYPDLTGSEIERITQFLKKSFS